MMADDAMLAQLVAKDHIRELVLLYSRGCDRLDFDLVRDLYTGDATDSHDESFDGPADAYVDFLAGSLPHAAYSGHHACNHLISVDVERGEGEGEVYALAWHVFGDGDGGLIEDFMCVRYIDRYRKCDDGRWRFARRVVTYDMRTQRPYVTDRDISARGKDLSYSVLTSRLFQLGAGRVAGTQS